MHCTFFPLAYFFFYLIKPNLECRVYFTGLSSKCRMISDKIMGHDRIKLQFCPRTGVELVSTGPGNQNAGLGICCGQCRAEPGGSIGSPGIGVFCRCSIKRHSHPGTQRGTNLGASSSIPGMRVCMYLNLSVGTALY